MNPQRVRKLNDYPLHKGSIIYWMNRDQRTQDNWALLYAQELALEYKVPLIVVFNLVSDYLGGGLRQFEFKTKGLQEIERSLADKNIPFFVVHGKDTDKQLIKLFTEKEAGAIVTDFCPLRVSQEWIKYLLQHLQIPLFQVDAHNIVPCWIASAKQEFAAYTFRPKINRLLPEFLEDFPSLQKQPASNAARVDNDWSKILKLSTADKNVRPIEWLEAGEKAANRHLNKFLKEDFFDYSTQRNDPNAHKLSDLSPYLHYGQISPQRVVLEVERHEHPLASQEAFLEEIIVRRELADNYCFYNNHYDSFEGFPNWAKESLNQHRQDPREHLYSLKDFEQANTHDPLWNAAQMEMVKRGKMHGYMRMYWAKKILEWTMSPEEAQKIAIYLNDRYELDGRDPNGYVGIAWSIGGVHDRAWFNRPIFGKVRYMSYNGCKNKFDIDAYCKWADSL